MEKKRIISNYVEPYKEPEIVVYNPIPGDIIPFGLNNLFPQTVSAGLRKSKYQRGINKNKKTHFVGTRFHTEDKKVQQVIDKANNLYSLKEAYSRNMRDFLDDGNTYMQIVTDAKKSFFQIYHIDHTKCRINKNLEVVINPDWANRTNIKKDELVPQWPKFKRKGSLYFSMIHIKDYEPEFTYYGIPEWIAALVNMNIDIRTDEWNDHHVEHGYKTDNIFVFPSDVLEEDIEEIKKNHAKFKAGKPGGFFYLTGDGTKVYPQNRNILDVDWEKLNRLNIDKMIVANSWYKSLMSISQSTGFDVDRVKFDYQLALTDIKSMQDKFLSIFKQVFRFFNYSDDLTIINESIIPDLSLEEKLVQMLPFFTEEQKAAIGTKYFDILVNGL